MRMKATERRRLEALLEFVRRAVSPVANVFGVAAALPWLVRWQADGKERLLDQVVQQADDDVRHVLALTRNLAASPNAALFADGCRATLLEELLAVDQAQDRRRRGVYYTPPEIVCYIVRGVDQLLQDELGYQDGLADSRVRLLDPATGSGVFLAEVVRAVHRRMHGRVDWSEYLSRQLLPRLTGWEIMPAAVVSARCVVAAALDETGFEFDSGISLHIEQRDALSPPSGDSFNVVIGNPPYASLSTAAHGWIEELIRSPQGGYTTIEGRPLGEKKHWLHDDYVKFWRLAQWQVEQGGEGVVGMVTNHGYLTNASFRGMRASLLKTFDRIDVVDLHGNAKMHERSPGGARDENVFDIASGAAIGLFARSRNRTGPSVVRHMHLWGARTEKLRTLELGSLPSTTCLPTPPHFRFAPADARSASSSADSTSWRLCDAMPLSTTAPVTARDHFVVAFTREELVERLAEFRNLRIDDDVIRKRHFQRTRSSRYLPGDSRGWKLDTARQALAADRDWENCIRLCQYRPWDYRYVAWHEALIDWPRREVLRHLIDHDNVALIARRQSPVGAPANYFWATRTLALDGIIRSDNRGSESLFPLWRWDDEQPRANFAPGFVAAFEQATGRSFADRLQATLPAADEGELTPAGLAGYLYGLFWSQQYRIEQQWELANDFPRIVLPNNAGEYAERSRAGLSLLRLHAELPAAGSSAVSTSDSQVDPGFPRWDSEQIWINDKTAVGRASSAAWEFRVGAHQIARKWLKDRRGRTLTAGDVAQYRWIVSGLAGSAED